MHGTGDAPTRFDLRQKWQFWTIVTSETNVYGEPAATKQHNALNRIRAAFDSTDQSSITTDKHGSISDRR